MKKFQLNVSHNLFKKKFASLCKSRKTRCFISHNICYMQLKPAEKWWAMRDSNPRPTACKAAALPLR